jgi:hypothetical protein
MQRFLLLGLGVGGIFGMAQGCASTSQVSNSGSEALVSGIQVLTQHNDVARTGANTKETILTTTNVKPAAFGKLFSRAVDGQVYAQPLYVGGLDGRNVIFVATEHNSVYAFDADDPSASSPIWTKNLGPSVPSRDTRCGLLAPEIGITSTPVIDVPSKTIWVSAKTKEGSAYVHRLHALDLSTGREKPNSPVEMTASVRGDAPEAVGGMVTMDPLKQMNRPGLLKVGNTIYIGFASQCDVGPYHGWVLAYDGTTMRQTAVHVDTPDGEEGGIWHGGVGLASDDSGDVYYASGNGTFDRGSRNFGNSTVRLHQSASTLSVTSWFTPGDSDALNNDDLDLGSTGVLLIPGSRSLVSADKAGNFYVVDRDTMGGITDDDSQIVQKFQGTSRGAFGGPAFWNNTMYTWGTGDVLKAYRWSGSKFNTTPARSTSPVAAFPGAQLSISSNDASNGILWTVRAVSGGPGLSANPGAGIVQAFDATDLTHELWNSGTSRDALGSIAKFSSPMIANGKVYVGTTSNAVVVYGLLGGGTGDPGTGDTDAGTDSGTADPGHPGSGHVATFTEVYNDLLGPGSLGHCGDSGCHSSTRGGFLCGATKASCYRGLSNAGLIDPTNGAASKLGKVGDSPLSWFGGSMPVDDPSANAAAAAQITSWLSAGAQNN